jgi:F-type H+-transporting ATPase subunit b
VKERIESVEKMKDVVSVTEGLFALSKETAQLESDAFVQRQKVALATEVKAVLDSWVRFEQQQKEEEQANLTKTVIANVLNSIKDEKTQKDILLGAIAEVERKCFLFLMKELVLTSSSFSFSQNCVGLECLELVKNKAV